MIIMEDNPKIITGSAYFFSSMPGFSPKDKDYVSYQEHPVKFKLLRQITKPGMDLFIYNKDLTFEEHVRYLTARDSKVPPMSLCNYLNNDFIKMFFGSITIEQLKQLHPLVDKMDWKHRYLVMIYNFYIENNSFTLTDEQRLEAYNRYKAERKIK